MDLRCSEKKTAMTSHITWRHRRGKGMVVSLVVRICFNLNKKIECVRVRGVLAEGAKAKRDKN